MRIRRSRFGIGTILAFLGIVGPAWARDRQGRRHSATPVSRSAGRRRSRPRPVRAFPAALVLAMAFVASPASATVLTFDIDGIVDGQVFVSGYGNRVGVADDGTFRYGADGGFTPHITFSMGSARLRTTGFGDLTNVAYLGFDSLKTWQIILSADAGHEVLLHGFDLAALGAAFPAGTLPAVLDSVEVRSSGALAFTVPLDSLQQVVSETGRTTFVLDPPARGKSVTIVLDLTTLHDTGDGAGGTLSDTIGIDNIRFSEDAFVPFATGRPIAGLSMAATAGGSESPDSRLGRPEGRFQLADLDGDGDPDLLTASYADGVIGWAVNQDGRGSIGPRQTIHEGSNALAVGAEDIDGDGDLDVVASRSGSGGRLAWYENLGGGNFGDPLTNEKLIVEATAQRHRPRSFTIADLDGDGDPDISYTARNEWYENNGAPGSACTISSGSSSCWIAHAPPVSYNTVGWWAGVASDVDLDGDLDMVLGNHWARNVGRPEGRDRTCGTSDDNAALFGPDGTCGTTDDLDSGFEYGGKIGTQDETFQAIAVADTNGDHYPDVLVSDCEAGYVAVYANPITPPLAPYDGPSDFRHYNNREAGSLLSSAFECVETILTADLNADGWLDALISERGRTEFVCVGATSSCSTSSFACEYQGGTCQLNNVREPVGTLAAYAGGWFGYLSNQYFINSARFGFQGMTADANDVQAVDIDLDGDLDVVAAFDASQDIRLFENRTIHSDASFGRTVIDPNLTLAAINHVVTADFDKDGHIDIAVAAGGTGIDWYRNDGAGGFTLVQQASTALAGLEGIAAADLDGDGDPDLVAAHQELSWLENVAPPGAPAGVDSGDFDGTPDERVLGTNGGLGYRAVAIGDLDDDGDLDLVAGGDQSLYWYENDGSPADGGWTEHLLDQLQDTTAIAVEDIDHDGDLDLFTAGGQSPAYMVWYRANLARSASGNSVTFTRQQPISTVDGPRAIALSAGQETQVSGTVDADVDVLVAGASGIVLHQNRLDEASASFGPPQSFSGLSFIPDWSAILAEDFDRDRVDELFLATLSTNVNINLAYRDGDTAGFGHFDPTGHHSLAAGDLDGDGDLDAVSTTGTELAALENSGSQFHVQGVGSSPSNVFYEGETIPLGLQVVLEAGPGDPSARVETVDLQFYDYPPSAPLTTAQVNGLVSELTVYRDRGDGAFDPGDDVKILQVDDLELDDDGVFQLGLPTTDPNPIVAAPATFFIALQIAPGAALLTPKDFYVLASGGAVRETAAGKRLTGGGGTTQAVVTRPVVGSFADLGDTTPGDGICDGGGTGCTLRAAIQEANATPGGGRIVLQPGTYTLATPGAGEDAAATGDLDITGDLTLFGAGPGQTIIDAAGLDRIFDIHSGTVRIADLTITGGTATGAGSDGLGGGIRNQGVLELQNVEIVQNTARQGGGLYSGNEVTVLESFVHGNTGTERGGGAALTNTASLFSSLVASNVAPDHGGVTYSGSSLEIRDSTLSGNQATGEGGGLGNEGYAIVARSTITNNSAGTGGGITNCDSCGGQLLFQDLILHGNSAVSGPDCSGTVLSYGYSIIGDDAGCSIANSLTALLVGVDPLLGPLQDNGGPTATHALQPGSPAIDAGRCVVETDQRGFPRIDLPGFPNASPSGSGCDIGAFEVQVGDALPRLDVPIRWCVLQGSPSFDFSSPTLQEDVNQTLRFRHENASVNIFEPKASIRLKSAANAAIPDYPILPDPVVKPGCPAGNVVLDPTARDFDEFLDIISMCREAWEAIDPQIKGVTAVNINRFVDPDCQPLDILGLGGRARPDDPVSQMAAGRVMVVDLVNREEANPPDLIDRLLAHEVGHGAGALQHGDGIDNPGSLPQCANGILDDDDDQCEDEARFDGQGLMQYRGGSELTIEQVQQARNHIMATMPDFQVEPTEAGLADASGIDGEFLNVLDFEFLNVLDFEFLNVLDFEFLNVLDFEFLNVLDFEEAEVLDFEFLNVLDFGMTYTDTSADGTTTLYATTAGLPWPTPIRPDFVYVWYLDLDQLDTTGGQASLYGFPGPDAEEVGVDLIVALEFASVCDADDVCSDVVTKTAFVWNFTTNDGYEIVYGPVSAFGEVEALNLGLVQETTDPEREDQALGMLLRPTLPNSVLLDALDDAPNSDYEMGDPVNMQVVAALVCEQTLPDGTFVDCQCTDCADCPGYPGCEAGGPGIPQAFKVCDVTGDECRVDEECVLPGGGICVGGDADGISCDLSDPGDPCPGLACTDDGTACTVDTDCVVGFCNGGTTPESSCDPEGVNGCGGFCPDPYAPCADSSDCPSTCVGGGFNGAPCSDPIYAQYCPIYGGSCQPGTCTASGFCLDRYSSCTDDTDCTGIPSYCVGGYYPGLSCNPDDPNDFCVTVGGGTCPSPACEARGTCEAATGSCEPVGTCQQEYERGLCLDGLQAGDACDPADPTDPCVVSRCDTTGAACVDDSDCVAATYRCVGGGSNGTYCDPNAPVDSCVTGTCSHNGEACESDSECVVGSCTGNGAACTGDADCSMSERACVGGTYDGYHCAPFCFTGGGVCGYVAGTCQIIATFTCDATGSCQEVSLDGTCQGGPLDGMQCDTSDPLDPCLGERTCSSTGGSCMTDADCASSAGICLTGPYAGISCDVADPGDPCLSAAGTCSGVLDECLASGGGICQPGATAGSCRPGGSCQALDCSGTDTLLIGDSPSGTLSFEPPTYPSCDVPSMVAGQGEAVDVVARDFPQETGRAMKVLLGGVEVGSDPAPIFEADGSTAVTAVIPGGTLSGRQQFTVELEGLATAAECFVTVEFTCLGDPSTGDPDGDGVCSDLDNCPSVANDGQGDSDGDGAGDFCDVCPFDPLDDADGDDVCGDIDNCPSTMNPDQANADGDLAGDACDECPDDALNDADMDGICVGSRFTGTKTGGNDNCPEAYNPDQENWDAAEDGLGDACDTDPILGAITNDGPIDEGSTVSIGVDATEPPAYGGGLEYRVDCDTDGTVDVGPQASSSLICAYDDDTGGPFTATVTVEALATGDESMGTTVVTVNGVPPDVGAITAPIDPVPLGTPIDVSVDFSDAGTGDTHTAEWSWGDGTTTAATVDETDGAGTVGGQHTYPGTGVYTVSVTITDDDGLEGTATFQFVVVYDPSGGFVTGGGFIDSPVGAYLPDPALAGKANFGFVAKYQQGATTPTGNTVFEFKTADFKFKSSAYEWLVVAGAKAQYKGTGTINGQGSYGFLLFAVDESLSSSTTVDLFRIKIWDRNAGDAVVYDNEMGAQEDADATTAISGGSIVIHKP